LKKNMKTKILAMLFLCSILAFAQIIGDVTAKGGAISALSSTLIVPTAPVLFLNGVAATGSVSLQTGTLALGSINIGGTFGAGGTCIVNVNGSTVFSGTTSDAQWTRVTLANGTHYYTLAIPTITDPISKQTGLVVLQTENVGKTATFPSGTPVFAMDVNLN